MDEFFDAFNSKREKSTIIKKILSLPSNYVGSKRRLLAYIWDVLEKEDIQFDSAFDAFSGSAMVSLLFKAMGKKIFSNDLLTSSAITAICLLESKDVSLTSQDIHFLCTNIPYDSGTFVLDNYKNKFFTEKECLFLDRYRKNVEQLSGSKYYYGLEILNRAMLMSIPNSNFSVYGKDLKSLRSTHEVGKSFWTEKWRDTTRKRRDNNNEIMFEKAINEMNEKYKSAFPFVAGDETNQSIFGGGQYYDGKEFLRLEHRLGHKKHKAPTDGNECVFNSDIIDLLESKIVLADLLYLDPPYGGPSSDYAILYSFLEEYLYGRKLEDLDHIQKGAKRFIKKNGYQEHFEHLLSLCGKFPVWLTSYNESSYATLDLIVSTIKNAGKKTVKVLDIPITYQYRKGKSLVEVEKTINGKYGYDPDKGKTHLQRGTEYLILAY